MGLVAPRHVGSSQTRAQTCVPCIGRQILNHCATREAPHCLFNPPLCSGCGAHGSEWQEMEGSALEASPEICSAAFQLGEVAGGCPGLGSAGGPHAASVAHLVGSWGGLTQRKQGSLPETEVKSGAAWVSTPATRSRDTGRLAFPRHGTRVGSTERLVFLLKFFSGRLLASVSGQAAGGWHS